MAYETSNSYKTAINKESRVTFIDGQIKGSNGVVIELSNEMLSPGSFYITNQCVNSDALEYGSVFAAELGITLKTEVDRYTLYDAEIKPYFNILTNEGSYERIPLGVFYINEPNRVGKNISIKAYDNMINLEEFIVEATTGTAYELLAYISARCNVSLAQTKEEINKLVNSSALLTVSPDRVSTYRELLSYICQVTCTFALFDRAGKLKLCEYSTTPSRVIEAKARTSSKFSDFETHFTGAKAELIYNDNYKSYMQVSETTGIIYDAGDIPIVQGVDTTNQAIVANMALKTAMLRYIPCDVSFSGDPTIELGDMITCVDRAGNEVNSLVTFYKWTYRGSHQIKSAGQNPKLLKVKDKSSKEMANLRSDISTKEVVVYTFTNSSKVEVQGGTDTDVETMASVASISFSAKKASTCMAMVTIPLEITEDSDVEFHQLFDGTEMLGGLIAQRCHKGLSTLTFVNYFDTKSNAIHRYSIVGKTKGVDGKEAGKITINPYSMRMVIFGQGLSSIVHWDGNVIVNDTIPTLDVLKNVSTISISEAISTTKHNYNPHQAIDKFKQISVKGKIVVSELTESIESLFDT